MKSKCLCVLAIDTSGSMLNLHNDLGISRIAILNKILAQFISKIKKNTLIADKLDICIVEIKEDIQIVVEPTSIEEIKLPYFETITNTEESIGLGIKVSIETIEKWKKQYFWAEFFKQNYTPYLILVTDQSKEYLISEEKEHPFKKRIEQLAKKTYLKFYGIGVGKAELISFFSTNISNIKVTDEPDFDIFFKDIANDLSKDLQENKRFKEEFVLIYKYSSIIFPFFKKHLKKIGVIAFVLSLFPISFRAIKSNGIKIEIDKLIEINYTDIKNYENSYPDNDININIGKETDWIGGDSDIKFTYDFKETIDNYNLGAYTPNSSDEVWQGCNSKLRKRIF